MKRYRTARADVRPRGVALVVTGAIVAAWLGLGSARIPAQQPVPVDVDAMFKAYEAGDFDVVARNIRTPDDYARLGPPLAVAVRVWSMSWRKIQAAFLFEIPTIALVNGWPTADLERALWGAEGVLRHGPGDPDFERLWYRAALGLSEASLAPDLTEILLKRAESRLGRFDTPGTRFDEIDARFALANGVIWEQRSRPAEVGRELGVDQGSLGYDRFKLDTVIDKFKEATRFDGNHAEVSVRQAFLQYRAQRFQAALDLLDAYGERTTDTDIVYWGRVFRARILDALGRPADARQAYVAALDVAPGAQSATLGLSALSFVAGDREQASAWAAAVRRSNPAVVDPWWRYWGADGRFRRRWLDDLRRASR
jgi:tetratricopeptide (TPR) repeat protein